jgi:hypothetical protein
MMTEERISDTQRTSSSEQTEVKPPLPKGLYRVINPIMAGLLRSPLHRLLSNSLMLLSFQGRKTGKRYRIPVGYVEQGNRLFLFSHSAWAKNFRSETPVSLRLRGVARQGRATLTEDPATIGNMVRLMVERNGEKMARRMGLLTDEPGTPARTYFIEITLEEPR